MAKNSNLYADRALQVIQEKGFVYNPGVNFGIGDFTDNNAKSWNKEKALKELLWRVRGLIRNNPNDEAAVASAIMYEVAPYVVATNQETYFRDYFVMVFDRYFEDLEDGLY